MENIIQRWRGSQNKKIIDMLIRSSSGEEEKNTSKDNDEGCEGGQGCKWTVELWCKYFILVYESKTKCVL